MSSFLPYTITILILDYPSLSENLSRWVPILFKCSKRPHFVSHQGLSMYLFMFAFLGNSFYVASIITSPNFFAPPPISTQFIRESIPYVIPSHSLPCLIKLSGPRYILGSGGTLMFDVTIITQSFIYRPKPRRPPRTSIRNVEEEAGLLSADSLAHSSHNSSEGIVHSRGRTSASARTVT